MLDPHTARDTLSRHLDRVYDGEVAGARVAAAIRTLGIEAEAAADYDFSDACGAIADELEAGNTPTVVMAGYGRQMWAQDERHEIAQYAIAGGAVAVWTQAEAARGVQRAEIGPRGRRP